MAIWTVVLPWAKSLRGVDLHSDLGLGHRRVALDVHKIGDGLQLGQQIIACFLYLVKVAARHDKGVGAAVGASAGACGDAVTGDVQLLLLAADEAAQPVGLGIEVGVGLEGEGETAGRVAAERSAEAAGRALRAGAGVSLVVLHGGVLLDFGFERLRGLIGGGEVGAGLHDDRGLQHFVAAEVQEGRADLRGEYQTAHEEEQRDTDDTQLGPAILEREGDGGSVQALKPGVLLFVLHCGTGVLCLARLQEEGRKHGDDGEGHHQ